MVTKELNETAAALVDLLNGDNSVYKNILSHYDIEKIEKALLFLTSNDKLTDSQKVFLLSNSWRIHYRDKPPTPEEFLTYKYIGRMAEALTPKVRKCFLEFFDSTKPYRNAVFFTHISWGKSTLSVLVNLYITLHLALMRDAKKYFGSAPSTILSIVLCSFNLKKSTEILLQPWMGILDCSEFFERVRTKENMLDAEMEYQQKDSIDKIYWTTASIEGTSVIQFNNDINVKLISSVHALLGLTIVVGTMTELAFFRDAGKDDSYIWRFFNDLKTRVESRMKGNYFGRTLLDSSPNDLDSPIDKYAMYEAEKNPTNYVIKGSRWQWTPEDFPNIDHRFPVFKGGNGKPPTILSSAEGYDESDLIWIPYDTVGAPNEMYNIFRDNIVKALKDQAGIPQGNMDKLFYDRDKIEACFLPDLKNIYTAIKADTKQSPYKLIWNIIKDDFFIKSGDSYRFYYKPNLPRVFHVDQAISGDVASVAFCHVERKYDNFTQLDTMKDLIYVVDFAVPIHPFGGRINLDAIKELITDVYTIGKMPLVKGSFDSFQSEANIQYLDRYGIEMEKLSVDKSLDPYMFLLQLVEQGNLKVGRNILFKNNLKSLRVVSRKISGTSKVDHTAGDVVEIAGADTNWGSSLLGYNAKDVSDSIAGAVYLAKTYLAVDPLALNEQWNSEKIIVTPQQVKEESIKLINKFGFQLPG